MPSRLAQDQGEVVGGSIIWTNVNKLPEPFAHLVSEDLYHEERERQLVSYCSRHGLDRALVTHYSASDLIKPPRMRVLIKRHFDEIVSDVSSHVYRVLGTAVHTTLRLSANRMLAKGIEGYIAEERQFTHSTIEGRVVVISGEPDLVTPDGVLHDYKVTAVNALDKGVKTEWEQATNIYAWLRELQGLKTKAISITFILRDWFRAQIVQQGYPPAPAQTMDVAVWPMARTAEFAGRRTLDHLHAEALPDDELPECTPTEMWEKPESWAVIREGGARAKKVYRFDAFPPGTDREVVLMAAEADVALSNDKLKKNEKPYSVEHRPGERTRCALYCDARGHCSQFKEYAAATYGKVEAPTEAQ